MSEEVRGIYKKMVTIMDNVGYIVKDMKITYGTTSYSALSETAVLTEVRKHLINQNVFVYCLSQERSRTGNLTSVDEVFRFVDAMDGSYVDVHSAGDGSDSQDKGIGMAQTYSFKYLFRRAFAIPTGDDPDRVSSKELDDTQKNDRVRKGKAAVLQLLEDNPGLSEDYRDSITLDVDTAVTKEDVDTLEIIYKEIKAEIRKGFAPEQKANNDKAVKDAKKYNEEPPLPKGKPAKSDLDIPEVELF